MSLRRTIGFALLGLAAAVVLVAGIVFLAGPTMLERVLAYADTVSRETTGRSLTFGTPPSFSLFPLGVRFENVRWGDESSTVSVAARSGHASVEPGSLLGGMPKIREVFLEGPVLHYRHAPGETTLTPVPSPAREESVQAPGGETSAAQDGEAMKMPFQLSRLVLSDGSVIVEQPNGDRLTLSKINLSVRGLAGGESGDVECDFIAGLQRVSGEFSEATLALRGSVELALPTLRIPGLQATLTPLSGLYAGRLGPVSLDLVGSYALDSGRFALRQCELALPHAKLAFSGSGSRLPELALTGDLAIEAAPARLNLSEALARVESFSLKGRPTVKGNVLELPDFEARVNGMAANGSLRICGDPLAVRGRLHCASIDVNRFLAGTEAKKGEPAKPRQRLAAREAAQTQTATLPRLDFTFTADRILCNGVRLDSVKCTVTGERGLYSFSPVHAMLDGQGQIDARGELNVPDSRWRTAGNMTNIPLGAVQKLAGKDHGITGTAEGTWSVAAAGTDSQALLASLSGSGNLVLRNVTIPHLTRAVRSTKELSSLVLPERVDRIHVPFRLAGGHCHWTADVTARGLGGSGKGDVNCLARRIDAAADLRVHGQPVPLRISGPLDNVSCAVDTERLLKELGRNLLETPGKGREGLEKIVPGAGRLLKGLF